MAGATETAPAAGGARLAELMGALSLATDIGLGIPIEHAQRSALLAVRLAERAGMGEAEARHAYYLSLLKTVGCTGDEDLGQRLLGEDMGTWMGSMGGAGVAEVLRALVAHVGRDDPAWRRAGKLMRAFTALPAFDAMSRGHCEVGHFLARSLGVAPEVVRGLGQVFERWDGAGVPHKLRGQAIDRAVRLAQIVTDAEAAQRNMGTDGAMGLMRGRRGAGYDPELLDLFCADAAAWFAALDVPSIHDAVMAAEPGPPERLDGPRLERAVQAMGEFADMKSRYTRGHSAGVAALARAAGERLGLAPVDANDLARAGHLHDIGRGAIGLRIWDKEGALTDAEWERVRMHTYYTERVLTRVTGLGNAPAIAALAHERLDGGGYHRRLPPPALSLAARVLAAADAFQAMTEPRPHRAARSAERAADELRRDAREGRLDREAVDAVLGAAGQVVERRRAEERPAGLSEREIQVLRLLTRGLTNKEIAVALKISTKTAGHHVQHIFEKTGLTTRAAAALFAMQNDLVREER